MQPFSNTFVDSLRDKMIVNNGRIPKANTTDETSFVDLETGLKFYTMGSGFAEAYMESWARLAVSIGWTASEVTSYSSRTATVLLTNQNGEQFSLSTMVMNGCIADISFKWLGSNIKDGTGRKMYELINGDSHSMLHRIEERLWYWVNKTPKPKPYKMNAVYEEQQRYILNKLDKVRKKNGLAGVK